MDNQINKINHIPVLLVEAVDALNIEGNAIYVDATLGSGGYSNRILNIFEEKGLNKSVLVSFDLDKDTINNFCNIVAPKEIFKNLSENGLVTKLVIMKGDFETVVYLVNDNFAAIAKYIGFVRSDLDSEIPVMGIVADLGLNSDQLDNKLGFSFQNNKQELDMRLDSNSQVRAIDILNALGSRELTRMFEDYADLKKASILSSNIKKYLKENGHQMNVSSLKSVIDNTFGRDISKKFELHAKVFQALRIAVNMEYANLEELLNGGFEMLGKAGKMVIISFHSGEDRIVKQFIHSKDRENLFDNTKNSIIMASFEEKSKNPRSGSAKMRVFSKIN